FFFQAEDGIRDYKVTGVQTCALPISLHRFYTDEWSRARVATLARLVDRAATEGDMVARDILLAAAQQLAALTGSVRRQLWEPGEIGRASCRERGGGGVGDGGGTEVRR